MTVLYFIVSDSTNSPKMLMFDFINSKTINQINNLHKNNKSVKVGIIDLKYLNNLKNLTFLLFTGQYCSNIT